MSSGFGIEPAAGVAGSGRIRPAAAQTASAPDLSGAKAVGATAEAAAGSNDPQRGGGVSTDYSSGDISIDAQSREVIYRAVDARARRRARQKPDEALLRNRAYSRVMKSGTSPPPPQSQADIEI